MLPYEDRGSEHRFKADEAYEIGERETCAGAEVSARFDSISPS